MIKNLTSVLFALCLVFLFLILTPRSSFAQESDFILDAELDYEAFITGDVHVTQGITLTNTKEFVYAPTYSISLRLKNIKDIHAANSKGEIPYKLEEGAQDEKTITVEFPERVVGVGAANNFKITFVTSDYLKKAGEIYTITLPATSNVSDFNTYNVRVTVPSEFKSPSIIKPDVLRTSQNNSYLFQKKDVLESGVHMVFGDKQYYRFKLSYNLENKNLFPIKTEIALPSDTAYQNIILENVSPKPDSVYKDEDGNTLASYSLASKTAFVVRADVLAETFHKPKTENLSRSTRDQLLRPQKYWETKHSEIQKIAASLKTPEDVFNYVVKALSYNFDKTQENNERLGARAVLEKPFYAVCLEFTDLFVALARAKGIPARSIEGFAYTQDDPLRPASLFQDVLHAWPEYYDDVKKTWIMVDPTWTDTTNGVDFFNQFDFDHVAFVKNGLSSTYPIPAGGYNANQKSKDVEVSFIDSKEFKRQEKFQFSGEFQSLSQDNYIQGKVVFYNHSNFETSPAHSTIFVDGVKDISITFPKTPPGGLSEISVKLLRHKGILASLTNPTHTITMQDSRKNILFEKQINVFPFSLPLLLGGGVLLGSIIIFTIAIKAGGLPIRRRKG